jgi:hypothetical protein
MKKFFLFLFSIIPAFFLNAQVLYTENFDNLVVGPLSTDATGVTAGQGGFYTQGGSIADYSVVAYPGKGNILQFEPIDENSTTRDVYKYDAFNNWAQRLVGNNVLKFSIDFYTNGQEDIHPFNQLDVVFVNSNNIPLGGFIIYIKQKTAHARPFNSFGQGSTFLKQSNGQPLLLPDNTWLTFEIYLDYNNNKAYYSIPALNYTTVFNTIPLNPQPHAENSTIPSVLIIQNEKKNHYTENFSLKVDNINVVAQNTVPVVTVGLDKVLANQFNIYPNPASNLVTITNNDNLPVQQITIYDTAGKQLSTQTFNNQTEIQLNVAHLASGTYMLHIQTTQGTAVKQLIKK